MKKQLLSDLNSSLSSNGHLIRLYLLPPTSPTSDSDSDTPSPSSAFSDSSFFLAFVSLVGNTLGSRRENLPASGLPTGWGGHPPRTELRPAMVLGSIDWRCEWKLLTPSTHLRGFSTTAVTHQATALAGREGSSSTKSPSDSLSTLPTTLTPLFKESSRNRLYGTWKQGVFGRKEGIWKN